jgi:hypothetical protein
VAAGFFFWAGAASVWLMEAFPSTTPRPRASAHLSRFALPILPYPTPA